MVKIEREFAYKNELDCISLEEIEIKMSLLQRILSKDVFEKIPDLNIDKVVKDCFSILDVKNRTKNMFVFPTTKTIVTGTSLYRVRLINCVEEIGSKKDVLNPPIEKTNLMRLNKKGESFLYASFSKETAEKEAQVKSKDGLYAMVEIEVTKMIETVKLEFPECIPILDDSSLKKIKLLNKTLLDIFSRKVDEDESLIYMASNSIGRIFMNKKQFDGWTYISVRPSMKEYNVCLFPDKIHDSIEVKEIAIYESQNGCLNYVNSIPVDKLS